MKTEFLIADSPRYEEVKAHTQKVYHDSYGAVIRNFAPLLVASFNAQGKIMCSAGIRTSADGFFSDTYLDGDVTSTILERTGQVIDASEIMEVVSLASATPFPVLAMMDKVVGWGRAHGMTLGLFTATAKLRNLLARADMPYDLLCPASPARVQNPDDWGSYYDTDPCVCSFSEKFRAPFLISPRNRAAAGAQVSGGATL